MHTTLHYTTLNMIQYVLFESQHCQPEIYIRLEFGFLNVGEKYLSEHISYHTIKANKNVLLWILHHWDCKTKCNNGPDFSNYWTESRRRSERVKLWHRGLNTVPLEGKCVFIKERSAWSSDHTIITNFLLYSVL